VPTLAEIFWGPLANGFRRMAEWRRRGVLGEALQAQRRRAMRFETLEPRLLLSADLTHAAPVGTAIDATLKVEDVAGAAILRLVDNQSSAILGEQLIEQDIEVNVQGSDQSDKLRIGFDRASVAHQIRVNFHGGEGGVDELFGPDRANTWLLEGPGSGSSGDGTFTDVERVHGGAGDDRFVVLDASVDTAVEGGAGEDTLVAADTDNTWVISGEDAGTLNDQAAFAGIENLTGGAGADTFIFAGGSISGTIDGGAGVNSFDYSSRGGAVTIDLETGVASGVAAMVNVTRVVGGAGDDTLVGRSQDNAWTLTAPNAGQVGAVQFESIENVTGGAGSDTFVFTEGASLDGIVAGGLGIDFLQGADAANSWIVEGADAGTLNDVAFIDIENLLGGGDSDTVMLLAAGGLAGTVSGGAGQDRLRGPDRKTVWRFTGAGSGNAGGTRFSGMEALEGGTQDDSFEFDDGAAFAGTVDGGAGADSLDYSASSSTVTVDLAAGAATGLLGFSGIEDV
jgi:hypothetical protein